VRAPGRINLIGEHTDYNNGFVLPASIDRAIYAGIERSGTTTCTIEALDLDEVYTFALNEVERTGTWADYVLGVYCGIAATHELREGFNLVIAGDIPMGAGLSSSAALECATAYAIKQLYGLNLDDISLVRLALETERTFVGLDCGIMDQYASVFGKKDHVLLIDCQTETHRYFKLKLNGYIMLLVNSGVTHALAGSAYNERRRQCEAGIAVVREIYGHVRSLREVSMDMLERAASHMDPLIFRRCAYVIRENERVLEAGDLLEAGSVREAGRLLFEAHEDMRENYEITCAETDMLVNEARDSGIVAGARQMGGGFGGCTINLVHAPDERRFRDLITKKYRRTFGKTPDFIDVMTAMGVGSC